MTFIKHPYKYDSTQNRRNQGSMKNTNNYHSFNHLFMSTSTSYQNYFFKNPPSKIQLKNTYVYVCMYLNFIKEIVYKY